MTNEELWRLFPIKLTPHDTNWIDYYESEKESIIKSIGPEKVVRINHIGSTAVPGLIAKPTVDILLEIDENANLAAIKKNLEASGYIFSRQPQKPPPHMMFMKGYTPEGFAGRVFHLHIRYFGDWDELYFRDYLVSHPKESKKYGDLKLLLKEKYEHDRDGYTEAKSGFINETVRKARQNSIADYSVK